MKSFREFRKQMMADPKRKNLCKLKRNYDYRSEERDRINERIREREEELFQQYISPPDLADLAKQAFGGVTVGNQGYGKTSTDQRIREQQDCDCGSSRAHHVNCPQHPGNLLPPVDYK